MADARRRLLILPTGPILALLGLSFLPRISQNPGLQTAFWGTCGALLLWQLGLLSTLGPAQRAEYQFRPVRSHYVQGMVQLCVFAYWGWHWSNVYDEALLILAQVIFAYAFEMLLYWSRGKKWFLGFGQFPIVFSTNLFLWFKDDWFHLQFLMIAVGILGKEFIRWRKDGRSAHIFNPSALSLTLASVALIVTGQTGISWGEEIAISFAYPEFIYTEIFLLGLVVQYFFSVTLMTLGAALSLLVLNLGYTEATGIYYFLDSNIPAAVFLGLHLLVTDPSTSPRTNWGRFSFGALYGILVFAMYGLLGWLGAPTFYDKLLCVPFLNLSVQLLDRKAASSSLQQWTTSLLPMTATPRQMNLGHMGVWVLVFVAMAGSGFVERRHPGSDVEFWQTACREDRRNGCRNLLVVLRNLCDDGSGAHCNELGLALIEGEVGEPQPLLAAQRFGQSCGAGHDAGCSNLAIQYLFYEMEGVPVPLLKNIFDRLTALCEEGDGEACYLVGYAYATGKGQPLNLTLAVTIYEQGCELGSSASCTEMARGYMNGRGVPPNPVKALQGFATACEGGDATGCALLGLMYQRGLGVIADPEKAQALREKACQLGLQQAC